MRILCLGFSYTGRYLAEHFEHQVFFLSRNADNVRSHGFQTADDLQTQPDFILDCVPRTDTDPGKTVYGRLIREMFPDRPVFIHISSTSVFGGRDAVHDGKLPEYNELTEIRPDDERGRNRLALEEAVLNDFPDAVIVRAGGIYGPGRCLPESVQSGRYRPDTNQMVSRIHVRDLCRIAIHACIAVTENPAVRFEGFQRDRLICAVDEKSTSNSEVMKYIEDEFKTDTVWPEIKDQRVTGRIISSLYAKELTGGFTFPDYRSGFRDCYGKLQ